MAEIVISKARSDREVWSFEGVDWNEYSRFLRAFEERPGYRLTYDEGTLEIMSPSLRHDRPGRFLGRLVDVLTEELELPLVGGGSVTTRRKLEKKGVEADDCFWIENAHRMEGRLNLNLRRDPPPDLAIEVDVSRSSLKRMAIYPALRVPEIWRLEGDVLEFFVLQANGKYRRSAHSKAFPQVSQADLLPFLKREREAGDETPIIRDFRKWVRSPK